MLDQVKRPSVVAEPTNVKEMQTTIQKLQAENARLQEELSYQKRKHEQWKSLAMIFHDSLWKMVDKYITK